MLGREKNKWMEKPPLETNAGGQSRAEPGGRGRCTSGRAEAIQFILVIVGRGGAPAVTIRATFSGAGRVGAALKDKRKHAGFAVPVAVLRVES